MALSIFGPPNCVMLIAPPAKVAFTAVPVIWGEGTEQAPSARVTENSLDAEPSASPPVESGAIAVRDSKLISKYRERVMVLFPFC